MADTVIDLALRVQGQEQAAALRAQIEAMRAPLAALTTQFGASDAATMRMAASMQAMTARADALDRQFGTGTRNWGRSILEGSRALEDLQYGVAGVLNNLPGLISSLGGTAGLAGAVSIVAVGATVLYRNWDKIASLWGQGHTKTEAERMKELADNTARTVKEEEKYQALKRKDRENKAVASKGESLSGTPNPMEAKSAGAVSAVIAAQGSGRMSGFDRMLDALKGDKNFVRQMMSQEERDKFDKNMETIAYESSQSHMNSGGQDSYRRLLAAQAANDALTNSAIYGKNPDGKDRDGMSITKLLSSPAALGQTETINNLLAAIRANPQEFRKQGLDPTKLALDIGDQDPRRLAAMAAEKSQKEFMAKVAKDDDDKSDARRKKAVDYEKEQKVAMAALAKREDEDRKKAVDYEKKQKADMADAAKREAAARAENLARVRVAAVTGMMPQGSMAQMQRDAEEAGALAPMQGRIDAQRQANQGSANSLMGRMMNAAGSDDAVMQLQMQARQNMAGSPRFQRGLAGLSFEDQEQAVAQANQQTDESIQRRVEARLLGRDGPMVRGRRMRGSRAITNDPLFARQLAQDIVARNRAALNGETGDQAVDRQTQATERLTAAMQRLVERLAQGVPPQLGP